MTLSNRRGTPTLSLKGSVCLPLFLFIFVVLQPVATPLFAQDLRNRTEEMYPYGTVIIAKEPLPDRIYESQKNKFLISVIFLEKGTANTIMSSMGTGFMSKFPGIVISARHVLNEALPKVDKIKAEKRVMDPQFDYQYMFMGTIITDTAWINFPLSLVAIGEDGVFKDIMVLRTDMQTLEKARISGDVINPNPYSMLLKTSKFANAKVDGKRVYITGFAPVPIEYLDKNKQPISVFGDLINFTFPAEITASIGSMPINKVGTIKLFRLLDSAEPGFSGGKVVNEQGEVVGMTIAMSISRNFVFVVSSEDIEQFMKDHKIR